MSVRDSATRSEYTGAVSSVRRSVALAAALLPGLVALGVASSSSAQEPAAASASVTSTASASPSSTPLRRKVEEPTEVEIIDLSDEPEPDAQAFAIGLQAGGGALHTNGSEDKVVPAADFSFTFDLGLGPGGARVPWTLEPFVAFAITRASLSSTVNVFPDRWTEIGARIVWRGEGSLDHHWFSFGLGAVWTSYGSCAHDPSQQADPTTGNLACLPKGDLPAKTDLTPALLVDVGVGLYEWTARFARYGFLLRAPVEISGHPGVGGIFAFYAQVGFKR